MTGIGTQYKQTTDAPNFAKYDELRALSAVQLRQKFALFEAEFVQSLQLSLNGMRQKLTLTQAKIDIVGYKKRPRKSILTYQIIAPKPLKTLSWQYPKIYGDSALRIRFYQANRYTWNDWRWLRNGQFSGVVNLKAPQNSAQNLTQNSAQNITQNSTQNPTQNFVQFVAIGFAHVIPLGWDHILFIVGMALSSLLWRRLLLLVTTFTLAHTLTLGLAMFGVVAISARIVEPLIAFSIAYVALENLWLNPSIRRKSVAVFLFGLIHGLGFAAMLQSFKMRDESFLLTLIGFNVGVELAQILIVLSVVSLLLIARALHLDYRKFVVMPASIGIAVLGIWWGVERMIG